MKRAGLGRAMGVVLALAALPAMAAANVQQFSHGRFEQIPVHMPAGTPQRVVIWFHEPTAGGDTSGLPIEALRADPALANSEPLGAGWFYKLTLKNPAELEALMPWTPA